MEWTQDLFCRQVKSSQKQWVSPFFLNLNVHWRIQYFKSRKISELWLSMRCPKILQNTVLAKKTGHLNFDFTKTLPTPSIFIAQQQAMVYSKACFLSCKMRYHLNLLLWLYYLFRLSEHLKNGFSSPCSDNRGCTVLTLITTIYILLVSKSRSRCTFIVNIQSIH